jgi:SAM-dependent methyltransferase
VDPRRRLSFGSVAELYDSSRPSYPTALVDDALAYAPPAGAGPIRVLEVGAGTGKATVLFAERGAAVLGVEPNAEMAALARRNLAAFGDVTVVEREFETWEPASERFQLLVCAQAWHWIEPRVRMEKAREALVEHGATALFWNRPMWDQCELAEGLRAAYATTVPEFGETPGPMHPAHPDPRTSWGYYGEDLDRAHGFEPEPVRRYDWVSPYTTDEYVRLIQTHSDHIMLPDAQRIALLDAVRSVIDDAGRRFELNYRTYLWLARRL